MRDFAQLHLSIWNDDEFRELTPAAQHMYFVLISLPGLERTGVNDWRPGRLVPFAAGWDVRKVRAAAAELIDKLFILVDEETEEYLVRSFVRNDGFMKQKNLATNMARSFALVASPGIRGVIVHELNRLKEEQPELAGWKSPEAVSLTHRKAIDPRVYPCSHPPIDPQVDPPIDPQVEGQHAPSVDPTIDPRLTTATATSTLQQEQERGVPAPLGSGSGDGGSPPHVSSDGSPPPAKGATPDEWSTHDDPRCRVHANWEQSDVPACRQCANAREWFEDQARAEVNQHRAAVEACEWCDERGLVEAHDTAGRPVALQCDHQNAPPEVEADITHQELTSAEKRRQLIDQAFNKPATTAGPF